MFPLLLLLLLLLPAFAGCRRARPSLVRAHCPAVNFAASRPRVLKRFFVAQ
jgi:hypothetical protein